MKVAVFTREYSSEVDGASGQRLPAMGLESDGAAARRERESLDAQPACRAVLTRQQRQHVAFLGGPGVTYEEFLPPPELARWVAVSWRIRADVDFELRIVPDGCMDLIRGDVIGSFSGPTIAKFRPGEVSEGVRFHPGGFPGLFRVPASELVDLRVPIADVLPRFRSLRELAGTAATPDPLARAAYAARDLRALGREHGYSERQLRRRVLAATGHGPKRLMRIARMQAVLRGGRGQSWARTAAEHGDAAGRP